MDVSPGQGRRSNGLPASSWAALVDLDPRLSEGLLASLAAAGVPAYVEPARSLDPFSRAATMVDRPLDRLWVDPGRADAARSVVGAEVADLTTLLAEQEPGATAHGFVRPVPRSAASRVLPPPDLPEQAATPAPTPLAPDAAAPDAGTPAAPEAAPGAAPDPDEAWRRIVEGFGREGDHAVAPWPVSEDVEAPGRSLFPGRSAAPGKGGRRRRRTDPPAVDPSALPGWVEPEALDQDGDEDHYVPPPAPPVPRLAPRKLAAVAAVLLGLLLLFVPSVLDVLTLAPSGVFLLGMLLVLGGAGALVVMVRDAPPTDSGTDDGAVV